GFLGPGVARLEELHVGCRSGRLSPTQEDVWLIPELVVADALALEVTHHGVDKIAEVSHVVGWRLRLAVVRTRPVRGRVQAHDSLQAKLVDQVQTLVVLLPGGL